MVGLLKTKIFVAASLKISYFGVLNSLVYVLSMSVAGKVDLKGGGIEMDSSYSIRVLGVMVKIHNIYPLIVGIQI